MAFIHVCKVDGVEHCGQAHTTVKEAYACELSIDYVVNYYQTCEHGLDASLCDGPNHYPMDRPEDDFPW